MTKHKHADLIHAWADGADIQYKVPMHGNTWYDCNSVPQWDCKTVVFRIKPDKYNTIVRWLWAYKSSSGRLKMCDSFYEDGELNEENHIKLEWSRTEFPE